MSKKISLYYICFHSLSAILIKKKYWQVHTTNPKRIIFEHSKYLWKSVSQYLQKIHWPVLGSNRLTGFSPSGICPGFKTRYSAQSFISLMCLASIKKHFLTQHAKLKERMWHTQACIRWAWFNHQRTRSRLCRILRIAFLPCFCFRFVFLFLHEGPKWVVRWNYNIVGQ